MTAILPEMIPEALARIGRTDELLEVILDLGRVPTARYTDGEVVLAQDEVSREQIDYVVARVGAFDADNRAGIERTLHRISAIRNRRGVIVGLTCRVGRAVYGTIDIMEDLIESGKSLLMLGPPGVGKTTMLREAARVLAESRRVVIVDTSNEIGGDGDVPHPAIGRARRMQVAEPALQHEVMIEAVENHNPEVIVIDEIGRELEAIAARTIAERGVQLIGTAHGNTLDNLLLNPTLSDLVGGIESVTLSDEEARRRGTQKTVLERRAPPTFDVLIEMQTRHRLALHPDVAVAVDALLRRWPLSIEIRTRAPDGKVSVEHEERITLDERNGSRADQRNGRRDKRRPGESQGPAARRVTGRNLPAGDAAGGVRASASTLNVYPYGVARNRLSQASKRMQVPVNIVDDLREAQAIVTLKNYYRRRPQLIVDAERRGLPIYVLRSNTITQMENFLEDVFQLGEANVPDSDYAAAVRETEAAISQVLGGARAVDLSPQSAYVRRRQHEMIRDANLLSRSYGKEPHRHVRVQRAEF
ncbi:MAG: AAA family ATPase [Anaerolineae bacterium]|nr:AAA family ATPase [Anaerolineae bacterium]